MMLSGVARLFENSRRKIGGIKSGPRPLDKSIDFNVFSTISGVMLTSNIPSSFLSLMKLLNSGSAGLSMNTYAKNSAKRLAFSLSVVADFPLNVIFPGSEFDFRLPLMNFQNLPGCFFEFVATF